MASHSSNPNQDSPFKPGVAASDEAEKLRTKPPDHDAEAMETFSFNVSAAESAKLKEQARADQPTSQKKIKRPSSSTRKELAADEETRRYFADEKESPSEPRPDQKPKLEVSESTRSVVTPSAPESVVAPQIEAAEPGTAETVRRRMPSWLTSLVVHAVVLLLLSFFTLATLQKQDDLGLVASTAAYEELDSFQEIEIDPSEHLESLDEQLASELTDPGESALGELSAESALADVSSDAAAISDSLGDLGTLFGDNGSGLSELGEGPGAAATASFFGAKVQGNRIVYVLDNSGGMRKGELETLVAELLKSVESLTPKQQFYIIFYSDALYPLFYPNAPKNFVRANEKNKQLLRLWLDSVEFCLGNVVDEAMGAALSIRPDVVYLLTDGDLDGTKDQRRMKFLLYGTGGAIPIHTIGMGTGETSEAATKLKQVAEANGGTFRAVDIAPEAKELAKRKARPYHNKEPGIVWGRRIGSR